VIRPSSLKRSLFLALLALLAAAGLPAQGADVVRAQAWEALIEAERQAQLSVPVQGAVLELRVRAGDSVRSGQLLLRVDARAAQQGAVAAQAQTEVARAQLELARRDLERQRQLRRENFISAAALDQAEAQFKAVEAQARAQLAQAGAAMTQAGWYELRAPFDGVVAQVAVVQGDMAQPGRPLIQLVDPLRLRATASLPLAAAEQLLRETSGVRLQIAGKALVPVLRLTRLPVADARSNTVELRADLPPDSGLLPGQFARLLAPGATVQLGIMVPRTALLRRGELDAVYVQGQGGKPLLRQVRLGTTRGEQVEVLAGLQAGDKVLPDARKVQP
jgi:membrane fusion protein, multidrug efflux system